MAKKRHISAVISLKDNMSATMRGIRREQKTFQKEVRATRKAMESINKKKIKARLDATQANKAFKSLKKNTKYIEARKKLVQVIAVKDIATAKLKKAQSIMKSLGKSIAKPVIMARDKASSIIKGIGGKLGALAKGVAIPLSIAAGGAAMALKGGAELEQQQISMKHFMGVGNKGKSDAEIQKMTDSYLKELRNNANATPFETGEVISAGTRALQISGGDTKKAMEKVKLAEDMAALNPGKTISDAMEALADARKNNANTFILQFLSISYYAIMYYIKMAYIRRRIWKKVVNFVVKFLDITKARLVESIAQENVKIVL